MPKLDDLSALGGVIPMIAANAGDKAGYALGLIPGLAYQNRERKKENEAGGSGMKKGGKTKAKKMAGGGQTGYRKVADGCATKGKTRGRMV